MPDESAVLSNMAQDMAVMKNDVARIVKLLDGNGKVGLVVSHAQLEAEFHAHLEDAAARDALIAKAAEQAPAPWKQNVVTWGSLLAGLSAFGSFAALIRVLTSTP